MGLTLSLQAATVTGERAVWHTITVTFEGPIASEADASTFWDHRLTVTFRQGEHHYSVPGFFAADGEAGQTHATSGDKWRVRFTPDRPGEWHYRAEFVSGPRAAIDPPSGKPFPLAGATGSFDISPSPIPPSIR